MVNKTSKLRNFGLSQFGSYVYEETVVKNIRHVQMMVCFWVSAPCGGEIF
jgi:hypothetical protein